MAGVTAVLVTFAAAPGAAEAVPLPAWPWNSYGHLVTLDPDRILDTRSGLGTSVAGPASAGVPFRLRVVGVGGVPTSGVEMVALNVTVTEPTSPAWLSVYPTGGAVPLVSTVNVGAGQTVANSAIVRVGAGGMVDVLLSAGTAHVVIDVNGFFADETYPGEGARLQPLHTRFFDSRATRTRLGPGQTIEVTSPRQLVETRAVAVNITAINPTANTFVTVFPGDRATVPPTSNVNVVRGQTRANTSIVRLSPTGRLKIYNHAGYVDIALDLQGWFVWEPGHTGGTLGRVIPLEQPIRVVDTRVLPGRPLSGGSVDTWTFDQLDQAFGVWVFAFFLNATATAATHATYLSLLDADHVPYLYEPPPWSDVNVRPHEDVANFSIAQPLLKTSVRALAVYNHTGATHYVLDVSAIVTGPYVYPGALPGWGNSPGPIDADVWAQHLPARHDG